MLTLSMANSNGQEYSLDWLIALQSSPGSWIKSFLVLWTNNLEVYLDDKLIFSQKSPIFAWDSYHKYLRTLPKHFTKLETCLCDLLQLDYLGYWICTDGIQMVSLEIRSILSFQTSRNVKDVQIFLVSAISIELAPILLNTQERT